MGRRRWRSQFTYTCAYEDGIVFEPTPQDDDEEEEEEATPSSAAPAAPPPPPPVTVPQTPPSTKMEEASASSSSTSGGSSADPLASYSNAVVLLYTSMTRDQIATVATRKVITQLKSLKVPYVELDGTDPNNKAVRTALWSKGERECRYISDTLCGQHRLYMQE